MLLGSNSQNIIGCCCHQSLLMISIKIHRVSTILRHFFFTLIQQSAKSTDFFPLKQRMVSNDEYLTDGATDDISMWNAGLNQRLFVVKSGVGRFSRQLKSFNRYERGKIDVEKRKSILFIEIVNSWQYLKRSCSFSHKKSTEIRNNCHTESNPAHSINILASHHHSSGRNSFTRMHTNTCPANS